MFYYVCIAVLHTLVAGLLARSQYPEGPANSHLNTGFSLFPCVYKGMLSPPKLNFLDPYFIFMYMHNNHCHQVTAHLRSNILLLLYYTQLKPLIENIDNKWPPVLGPCNKTHLI